jgi:hypothetical protein
MLQNASIHRFAASTHYTLKKEFYFFPGLTSSGNYENIKYIKPLSFVETTYKWIIANHNER